MNTDADTDAREHATSDTWEASYLWTLGYRPERIEGCRPRSTFVFRGVPTETLDAYRFDRVSVSPRAFGFAYKALLRLLH